MLILRDLLDAAWDVTLLQLDLRKTNGELIQHYQIGEGQTEAVATIHQKHDMAIGKLEMIDAKINRHGDVDARGNYENGWGPNFKAIPKDLLDAEVIHFTQRSRSGPGDNGSQISAWICSTQLTMSDVME